MRALFKWFVLASLLFLGYYLARQGLLEKPRVYSYPFLLLSIVPLFAGFLGGSVTFRRVLVDSGLVCSFRECLASMGLSVFGKYAPGKIWILLGRAAYIAEGRGFPVGRVSTASFNDQFAGLWGGLFLGAIGILWVGGLQLYGWLVAVSLLGISLLVFSPWVHGMAASLIRALLRRPIEIPALNRRAAVELLPWVLGYWIAWSLGFYLLVCALSPAPPSLAIGLAFPLAGSLGVMAVIAPGGLGAREGILVGYLTLAGIPLSEAVTISVVSRAWFLLGEVLFFVCGFAADRTLGRRSN